MRVIASQVFDGGGGRQTRLEKINAVDDYSFSCANVINQLLTEFPSVGNSGKIIRLLKLILIVIRHKNSIDKQ